MKTNNLFWGIILVLAGSLFLLDNYGILTVNLGLLLPIFLIVLGAFTLFARNWVDEDSGEAKAIALPLAGAKEAQVSVEHGAGRIHISGVADGGNLVQGKFYALDLNSDVQNGRAELRLRSTADFNTWLFPWNWGGYKREWDFRLNPDIPIDLEIESGASEVRLDLSALKVRSLDVDAGASSVRVTLPEKAGYTDARIDAGASSIHVTIPAGVAARIRAEAGLGSVHVDQARFPRSGKGYESPDYASSSNKVDLRVEVGASSIHIQ